MEDKTSEDLKEDLGTALLNSEEMKKYNQVLDAFYYDIENVPLRNLIIDNAIILSDNLKNIKIGYLPDAVQYFKDAIGLIGRLLPKIKDRTVRDLLKENQTELLSFCDRFGIPFIQGKFDYGYTPDRYRPFASKLLDFYDTEHNEAFKKKTASMAKEVTLRPNNEELSKDWRDIATNLKDEYENQKGISEKESPELDLFLAEGLKKYRERQQENEGLKVKLKESDTTELSNLVNRHNALQEYKNNILKDVANLIIQGAKEDE